jgi:hypothetical protein
MRSVPALFAGVASALAVLGVLAALLDSDLMPLGVPIAAVLGLEALVAAGFVVVPSGGTWSPYRRNLARVATAVWVGLAALVLGLGSVVAACACVDPNHVPRLLLGVAPFPWVATAAIANPILLAAASLGPRRPVSPPAEA